jgi:hypothetical protein
MQSRRVGSSEMACLRSEDILFIALVACVSFSRADMPGDICESSVVTLRTFIFVVVLGTSAHLLHLLTLLLFPLMR